MNEVVFFSLFLLIFIKLIGLGVSVDFYLRFLNLIKEKCDNASELIKKIRKLQ